MKRALISVSDKTGVIEFARGLIGCGYELVSTGGTHRLLTGAGLDAREVRELTGFPEMLGGRLKTLHPKVHGGILYLRGDATHREEIGAHGIEPIDLVAVNLYPFERTVGRPDVTLEEAIEQIDIGGPAMIRSAAKNYRSVTVVVDPGDYAAVLEALADGEEPPLKLRERLALKAFTRTSQYDSAIANYLNRAQETAGSFCLSLPLENELRHGENPHQRAGLYGRFGDHFEQLQGKDLSYNNILDISAAGRLIAEFAGFDGSTVAILKHTNPCGVGSDPDQREAWDKAFATDKQAPFGGIIICDRPLGEGLARAISEIFSEVIIAPEFDPGARAVLQRKKNLRLMRMLRPPGPGPSGAGRGMGDEIRSVIGGVLAQTPDPAGDDHEAWKTATRREPTGAEVEAMRFAWRVVKHVKSNAIVFAGPDRTLGIGAGQMSRVDACRIAIWKAGEAGLDLRGSAVGSDAFFPFPDGLLAAAEAGATAAIQPGGSMRDPEVIAAADGRSMAMVLTGRRHFRH